MPVTYLAPFNNAEADFDVIDAKFGQGYFLDLPGMTGALAGLGANAPLAIEAHGNNSPHHGGFELGRSDDGRLVQRSGRSHHMRR